MKKTLFLASSGEQGLADLARRLAEILKKGTFPALEWHYEPMPDEKHSTIYHPAALRAFRLVFKPGSRIPEDGGWGMGDAGIVPKISDQRSAISDPDLSGRPDYPYIGLGTGRAVIDGPVVRADSEHLVDDRGPRQAHVDDGALARDGIQHDQFHAVFSEIHNPATVGEPLHRIRFIGVELRSGVRSDL